MSQEKKEKTIVAEATVGADTSKTVSAEAGEPPDAEEAKATGESSAEDTEVPDVEDTESVSETTVAEAAEEPASEEPEEEVTAAVSEVEEAAEKPEEVVAQAEEEPAVERPAAEETVAAEKEPEEEEKPEKEEKEPEPEIPLSELEAGAEVTGRVVGIAKFGAFVDIGAETDGLVHISELSEGRVNKVSDVVSVGQEISVWIKDVDTDQERISLSMKPKPKYRLRDLKPGMVVEGTVTGIRNYGVFVDIGAETEGLVHVSEMAEGYVNQPSQLVSSGEDVEVRVKKVDRRRRRISLSMKGLGPSVPPPTPQQEEPGPTAIELAMRQALDELEEREGPEAQVDVEDASRDELSEVYTRMLRNYREDAEEGA